MVMISLSDCQFSMDGYLEKLLSSFKKAVQEKNTSVVIVIDGRSGMGKTTLSNQVSKYLDNRFNLPNIYFTPDSFLEGLANAEKFSVHAFDEAMLLSNRSTMSQINKMIVQAMSMIRSKNIFVIFNINSVFDLDKNLALSRADLLLHVYGDNLIDRGNFAAFFKAKGQEDRLKLLYLMGKKFYSYSKPKANFFGSFSSNFIIDEQEYEIKKQQGVNAFLRGETQTIGKHNLIEARLIKYLFEQIKISADEIANIAQINTKSVYNKLKLVNEGLSYGK